MCKRKHFSSNDHNKRKMIRSNEHKIRISINSNNLKTRLIFRQKYHLIRIILMSNERKKRKAFCRNRRNISLIPRQNVLFVEFFSGERTFMQSAILALLTLPLKTVRKKNILETIQLISYLRVHFVPFNRRNKEPFAHLWQ